MAYALGFPKDVTDCIMGMRDFRWEMVRDGGKTPSASCLNRPSPTWNGEPFTTNMVPGKEYITTICMPVMFGIPCFIYGWQVGYSPAPGNESLTVTMIHTWRYVRCRYDWDMKWEISHTWTPKHPETKPRVADVAELWWQCESC